SRVPQRLTSFPYTTLFRSEDRLRDGVARAERIGELLAVGVQEGRTVGASRLRDRVALHRRRPRAAVRVVLQRVEVAALGADVERSEEHTSELQSPYDLVCR